MAALLFDAAYKPTSLAAVKAAGGIAMSVYLTGNYAGTCAQPADLHAADLGSLGNYEQDPGELTYCGQAGGVAIGQKAAAAYIAKGAPAHTGLGIAFSVDVNAPPSQFPAIAAALTGVKQGLAGRFVALIYGEGALIDYLVSKGIIGPGEWLAAPTSWPGFNAADPNMALVQQVGTPVPGTDEDKITNLDAVRPFIWWPAGSPYAEDNMTPEQVSTAVWTATHKAANGTSYTLESFVVATDEYANRLVGAVAKLQASVDALAASVAKLESAQAAQSTKVGVTGGSITFGPPA